MMTTDKIGLYVHIPFCVRKCSYCDFCSFPNLHEAMRSRYIKALKKEIESYKRTPKISVETIFFGGGTPSLLEPLEFSEIYKLISSTFDLSDVCEFTVEANPKTLTQEKLRAFKSAGVNRISIGMQSIHENELKKLGRIHSYDDFLNSYSATREAGFENINVDVMYGIPEQTKESFLKTLEALVSLSVPHISVYGLMIEEGTPFWNMQDELCLPSEDCEADLYYSAVRYLSKNGYKHYEISNYAKHGCESLHNLLYWRNREYIGLGISAHSYFNGIRYGNTDKLDEYLSAQFESYRSLEKIDKSDEAYEYAMLALRLSSGFSLSEYQELFGEDFRRGREEKLKKYEMLGFLQFKDGRIALTDSGFYVSNSILCDLL